MIAESFGRWNPTRTWRTASSVDKVRLYTRQSFFVLGIFFGIFGGITEAAMHRYLGALFVVISAAAAVIAVDRIPELGGTRTASVKVPVVVMTVAALCSAVIALPADDAGQGPYFWLAMIVPVPFAALVSWRWVMLGAAVAAGVCALAGRPEIGILVACVAGFMTFTVQLSVWLLRMVTELDEARGAAAALSVAEERLRFSRDLHDVVGRALSAIAVKSDLAATLSRRGDDRAAQQMDEVRDLAQESLAEARELVRGYRSIALASELAGARSLLEAAGITTDIRGSADALPIELAETAAWVVREGVTNILRHSSAQQAVIEVTGESVSIANDGAVQQRAGDGTGVNGLRERVTAVGGILEVIHDEGTFTLTAHFSSPIKESR